MDDLVYITSILLAVMARTTHGGLTVKTIKYVFTLCSDP
jgi:hypothetical protein